MRNRPINPLKVKQKNQMNTTSANRDTYFTKAVENSRPDLTLVSKQRLAQDYLDKKVQQRSTLPSVAKANYATRVQSVKLSSFKHESDNFSVSRSRISYATLTPSKTPLKQAKARNTPIDKSNTYKKITINKQPPSSTVK